MAGDNRSLIESGYYQGLQCFEYFIVGVSLALCAYVGHTLQPEKLTLLSAYTIEVVSLALFILSAGVGLKVLNHSFKPVASTASSSTQ